MSTKKKRPVTQEFCTVNPDAPSADAPATEADKLAEKAGIVELSISEEARLKLEAFDKMAAENAKYAEQVSELQDRIAGYISETAELKAQAQAAAPTAAEASRLKAECLALRAGNRGLKAETAELKSENGGLKSELGALKAENDRLKAENGRLKAENDAGRSERDALGAEFGRLNAEFERLKKELEAAKNAPPASYPRFSPPFPPRPAPGGLTPNHYRRHITKDGYSSWN